jgi:hypothetical protein
MKDQFPFSRARQAMAFFSKNQEAPLLVLNKARTWEKYMHAAPVAAIIHQVDSCTSRPLFKNNRQLEMLHPA